jgi:hypothetical protein
MPIMSGLHALKGCVAQLRTTKLDFGLSLRYSNVLGATY